MDTRNGMKSILNIGKQSSRSSEVEAKLYICRTPHHAAISPKHSCTLICDLNTIVPRYQEIYATLHQLFWSTLHSSHEVYAWVMLHRN